MKKQFFLATSVLLFMLISCKKDFKSNIDEPSITSDARSNNGQIKIAVLSDIHYMDPSLLQNNAENGTAFKSILASEPYKVLLPQSSAILDKVISNLIIEHPDIVLVAGDMSKDGEKVSHESVASYFNQLKEKGIKVFLIPGNNDINNPTAYGYNGNSFFTVPNVNPTEFKSIYSDFGYNTAIASDPNSLSYVAQAAAGLWVLAIDAERYSPIYHRSGTIKPQTMQWIKQQMLLANQNNITVLGLMHHNLIEHFAGQSQITPNTIVEDLSARDPADNMLWEPVADSLMSWGLKVIFTGHSHITDISERVTGVNTLYDVATGSLVTPPSPYRIMLLKNKELDIDTKHVTSIDVLLPGNQSFVEYSKQFLTLNMDNWFRNALASPTYKLTEPALSYAVPLATDAFTAYITGDEKISPLEQFKIDSLETMAPPDSKVIMLLTSLWTDLGVKDNKWHFKIQ